MAKTKIKFQEDESAQQPTAEDLIAVIKSKTGKHGPVEIMKAKLKDDLFIEVEYVEKIEGGEKNVKEARDIPVHDDLKSAFSKLNEHFGRITEQFNSQGDLDSFNMNCKGFTISGVGDNEGVSLIGYRGLDSGKYLNMNSPFTKWNEEYEQMDDLGEAIEECKNEVMLFLFEKKRQPEVQQELPFEHDEDL